MYYILSNVIFFKRHHNLFRYIIQLLYSIDIESKKKSSYRQYYLRHSIDPKTLLRIRVKSIDCTFCLFSELTPNATNIRFTHLLFSTPGTIHRFRHSVYIILSHLYNTPIIKLRLHQVS